MRITIDFSMEQDLDCRLLEGAMSAMSRCLVDHLSERAQGKEEGARVPVEAGADGEPETAPAKAVDTAPASQAKPRARKPRKAVAEMPEGEGGKKSPDNEAESTLFATPAADPGGQDEAKPEGVSPDVPVENPEDGRDGAQQAMRARFDLPLAEGAQDSAGGETRPKEEKPKTMTAQDFRQALAGLRERLGVKCGTPESTLLAREISARCETLYGTAKPSTLPGEKLAEFVGREMSDIVWNGDHTGFTSDLPF
ncbi:MAG TPA: hypothetical protein DC006_04070 [Prevotellaceae bacterium]|nr:hypothetical protein [Prevotellaceae bacterium]